jgi:hypothetical protein
MVFFARIKSIGQIIKRLGVFFYFILHFFSFGGDSGNVESRSPSTDASKSMRNETPRQPELTRDDENFINRQPYKNLTN